MSAAQHEAKWEPRLHDEKDQIWITGTGLAQGRHPAGLCVSVWRDSRPPTSCHWNPGHLDSPDRPEAGALLHQYHRRRDVCPEGRTRALCSAAWRPSQVITHSSRLLHFEQWKSYEAKFRVKGNGTGSFRALSLPEWHKLKPASAFALNWPAHLPNIQPCIISRRIFMKSHGSRSEREKTLIKMLWLSVQHVGCKWYVSRYTAGLHSCVGQSGGTSDTQQCTPASYRSWLWALYEQKHCRVNCWIWKGFYWRPLEGLCWCS